MAKSATMSPSRVTTGFCSSPLGVHLVKRWLDAHPIQLWLTVLWATVGTAVSLLLRNSILWVSLISVYAIVISHWTTHQAKQAKQAAEGGE